MLQRKKESCLQDDTDLPNGQKALNSTLSKACINAIMITRSSSQKFRFDQQKTLALVTEFKKNIDLQPVCR